MICFVNCLFLFICVDTFVNNFWFALLRRTFIDNNTIWFALARITDLRIRFCARWSILIGSTSHIVTIYYGDKDLVDFYELTKYFSFSGAVNIDHQRQFFRSQWLSDWVTNSVPHGIKYRTIVGIVRTIVRALTEFLRVTYLSTFPIFCQLLLTSLSRPCCRFIWQLGICPISRLLMKFKQGFFFKGGQVWTLASKKYPIRHGDGWLRDIFWNSLSY